MSVKYFWRSCRDSLWLSCSTFSNLYCLTFTEMKRDLWLPGSTWNNLFFFGLFFVTLVWTNEETRQDSGQQDPQRTDWSRKKHAHIKGPFKVSKSQKFVCLNWTHTWCREVNVSVWADKKMLSSTCSQEEEEEEEAAEKWRKQQEESVMYSSWQLERKHWNYPWASKNNITENITKPSEQMCHVSVKPHQTWTLSEPPSLMKINVACFSSDYAILITESVRGSCQISWYKHH